MLILRTIDGYRRKPRKSKLSYFVFFVSIGCTVILCTFRYHDIILFRANFIRYRTKQLLCRTLVYKLSIAISIVFCRSWTIWKSDLRGSRRLVGINDNNLLYIISTIFNMYYGYLLWSYIREKVTLEKNY